MSSQLPEGWEEKCLGEICENLDSKRIPITKAKRVSGDIPYYGASGIVDYVADYIFDEDLLLISEDGANLLARTYPIAFSVSGKTWINNHAHVLRFNHRESHQFVEYFFNSISLEPYVSGMAQPKLNQKSLNSISVPLPPLPEQKRIVAILDKAFEGINQAIANAEKNLANAREIFESYLNDVFTRKGEGWEEKKLGDIYDVRDGTHDSPKYQKKGYPLITSKNLKHDGLNFDKIKYISEEDYTKINKRSGVSKGDVLFAMIGTIGNPIVVEFDPEFSIKNVALFKPLENQNSAFLRYYLLSELAISKMRTEAKGTTQKFVGLGYLRGFPICIPKIETQQKLVSELDALSAKVQHLESIYQQKLTNLQELKQSILQKAFSGNLDTSIIQ